MLKYSVGLDMGKESFHACFSELNELQQVRVKRSGKFSNNPVGFEKLIEWIASERLQADLAMIIIMEATGVYHEQCALFLYRQGFDVSIVLPNKAKKYISALGIKTKNDKSDAASLSHMGARQPLELWQPMGSYFYELRALTRHHKDLKENQTIIANQIESLEHSMYASKDVLKSLKKILKTLETAIKTNEKAIAAHIKSNAEVATKVENITAIKGVGMLTAAVILGETNGFLLFKNQGQLVSYAGYDVVENQSGMHVGKTKISKKGNSNIRRILHMPALTAVTYQEPPFVNLYLRTYERHKVKMKSYVAVQKKLLCVIYTLWKKNEKYDPTYLIKNTTREGEMGHSSRPGFAEAV
jgi:transposase